MVVKVHLLRGTDYLSGFYLRSVLFQIGQIYFIFRFIASYFSQLMLLTQFRLYVHKIFHSLIYFAIKHI